MRVLLEAMASACFVSATADSERLSRRSDGILCHLCPAAVSPPRSGTADFARLNIDTMTLTDFFISLQLNNRIDEASTTGHFPEVQK